MKKCNHLDVEEDQEILTMRSFDYVCNVTLSFVFKLMKSSLPFQRKM